MRVAPERFSARRSRRPVDDARGPKARAPQAGPPQEPIFF